MEVDLSKLPKSIQRQIPLSLRTFKDVYDLEELPVRIQYIIRQYFEKQLDVKYKVVYDFKSTISKYNDFQTIENVTDLIVEYLKNYLLILPGTYPWDPTFGSRLKFQLQTRDLNLRQTLISNEINNIIQVIADQVDADIVVEDMQIIPTSMGANTEYSVVILLKINNEQRKQINVEFSGTSS